MKVTNKMIAAGNRWLQNWQHMDTATRESNLEEAFKAMFAASETPPTQEGTPSATWREKG